jgi:hypothetical protein
MNDNVHYHSVSWLVSSLRVQLCLSCFGLGFSALDCFLDLLVKMPAMPCPVPKTL